MSAAAAAAAAAAALSARQFDVVVLGATGFTGERIALYLLRAVHGLPTGNQVDPTTAAATTGAAAGAGAGAGAGADVKTPASPSPASVRDAKTAARKRTVALAGRSAQKLVALRQKLYKQLQRDAGAAGGAVAERFSGMKEEEVCAVIGGVDVSDEPSLARCASAGRVLVNAVGPYRFYGEAVVKACIGTRTHYVDITGETEFMERMHVAYDDAARKAGVTLVMACGFDSLIADLGVVFTQRAFDTVVQGNGGGVLARVDSVLRVYSVGPDGVTGHATTLEALLESLANVAELRKNRTALKAKQTAQFGDIARVGRPPKSAGLLKALRFDKRVGRWTLPFMGSDSSVVRNSQHAMYAADKASGLRHPTYPYYATTFSLPSLFWALFAVVMGVVLFAMSRFRVTRSLMNRYPRLLTLGAFTHEGPTAAQLRDTRMVMDFFGEGYASEEAANAAANAGKGKDAKAGVLTIHTAVSGPEPGYLVCSIVCGQSVFTLLDECDAVAKASKDGGESERTIPHGVLTPAPAFRGTDLIERCHAEGVRFQVVAAPVPAVPAAAAGAAAK